MNADARGLALKMFFCGFAALRDIFLSPAKAQRALRKSKILYPRWSAKICG
jgi:hypothetical protein